MEIAGVHHVSLNVDDVDAAVEFYVGVLGLSVEPRPDFAFPGAWLGFPDGRQVHLIGGDDVQVPPAFGQHFAVHTHDLDAAVAELRGRGIEVSDPKRLPTGARQAFTADPSGNRVELHQPVG